MNVARSIVLLGGCLLFPTAGCGDDPPPPPDPAPAPAPVPPGTVAGQALLFDSLDHGNSEIALAVRASSADAVIGERFVTTTAPNGAFAIPEVPPGSYVVTIKHDSYVEVVRDSLVVPERGSLDLGVTVLTRAKRVVDGHEVVSGFRSPAGEHQFFSVDGQLGIYGHESGRWMPFPRTVALVNGAVTPDAQNALLFGSSGGPALDALYAAKLPSPDGKEALPTLVASNVTSAGVSPNGARGFVFTSTGVTNRSDLYTFTFAQPGAPQKLATHVSTGSGALTYIPAESAPKGTDHYPLYAQIAFEDNPHSVGGIPVEDFNVFDLDAGSVVKIPNVQSVITLQGGTAPRQARVLVAIPDGSGLQRDLHLWLPGVAAPIKVTPAPIAGAVTLDTTSVSGRVFALSSGGTSVSVFDVGPNPSYRPALTNLLWPVSGTVSSTLGGRGWAAGGQKYLALFRNGGAVDLASYDLATLTQTIIQSGVTKVGGAAVTSSDDLRTSTVARELGEGARVITTNATASTLTPVIVDASGSHPITGTFDASAFTSLVRSDDGKGAAFVTAGDAVTFASVPAIGAAAPTTFTASGAVTNLAISPDASQLAYVVGDEVITSEPSGANAVAVMNVSPSAVSALRGLGPGVLALTTAGQAIVAQYGVAASGTVAFASGALAARAYPFAGADRFLVHDGSSSVVEVDTSTTPITVTAPFSGTSIVMHPSKARAVVTAPSGATAVGRDGSRDVQSGAFVAFAPARTSPNGKFVYVHHASSGRLLAYGETGAPVEVSTGLRSSSSSYVRTLAGGVVVFIEIGSRTLAAVKLDDAARAEVLEDLTATFFASGPTSSLAPWIAPSGRVVFAASNVNAKTSGAAPNLRLVAYDGTVFPLGDNIATSSLPFYDKDKKNLLIHSDHDSLHGTTTLRSFSLSGGASAVMLMEKGRSHTFSANGKAVAAVVVANGRLELQSARIGMSAASLGPVGFASLRPGDNFVFSDDESRVFAVDIPSSSAPATSAVLITGAVGAHGGTAVTMNVVGVYPNTAGTRAAVLTRDVDGSGQVLQRYVSK